MGVYMGRISSRTITHTRCLYKADQILKSVQIYLRNGGYEGFRRGDFSKVQEAIQNLLKLRFTALSKVEYNSFRSKILASLEAEIKLQKSGSRQEVVNLVSTVEAGRYKKHLKEGKRSMDPHNKLWIKDET
jgi:hypothetical protein